eukprot:3666818-Rhodomonas_salina.2
MGPGSHSTQEMRSVLAQLVTVGVPGSACRGWGWVSVGAYSRYPYPVSAALLEIGGDSAGFSQQRCSGQWTFNTGSFTGTVWQYPGRNP